MLSIIYYGYNNIWSNNTDIDSGAKQQVNAFKLKSNKKGEKPLLNV